MSLYVDPKQSIIDATNTANATALKLTDVNFGAVSVASADVLAASGKNSSVRLTGNGSTWSGTVVVNYTRLDLKDLATLVGSTLKVAKVTQVHDLLNYFNYFYGMVLTTDDVENDPITLDENGGAQITVRAKAASYGWVGTYPLTLVKGDAIVDFALTDTTLDGLNYPTGQTAKSQGPLALYGFDFTPYKTLLDSLPKDTVLNGTAADTSAAKLAAAMTALDVNGWASQTSAAQRNIYMGKVVYAGLNKPEFATNQNYKYVTMIQLPDGTGNNGVPTTVYNTLFVGLLYLHYNDPEDPNAVT